MQHVGLPKSSVYLSVGGKRQAKELLAKASALSGINELASNQLSEIAGTLESNSNQTAVIAELDLKSEVLPPSNDVSSFAQENLPTSLSVDSVSDVAKKIAQQVSEDATSSTAQASESMAEISKSLTEAATAVSSQLSESAGSTISSAQNALGQLQAGASSIAQEAEENLDSIIGSLQSQINETTNSVSTVFVEQANATLNLLPPNVREALYSTYLATSNLLHEIVSDPTYGKIYVAFGIGIPSILVWNAAYGGFAGILSPARALDLLASDADYILLDVRTQLQREKGGVPQLKRRARGKGVALSPVQLPGGLSKRVRNGKQLETEMLGAQAAFLKILGPQTSLIILDDDGSSSKSVARAASRSGVRKAFIVKGGFKKWVADGLSVDQSSTYADNPLGVFEDAAEVVAEEATSAIKSPTKALALGSAAFIFLATIFNYHIVLRTIGVIGIEATIAWRLLQYDSPQELADDVLTQLSKLQDFVDSTRPSMTATPEEPIRQEDEAIDQMAS